MMIPSRECTPHIGLVSQDRKTRLTENEHRREADG
jgi:hypothetical protein